VAEEYFFVATKAMLVKLLGGDMGISGEIGARSDDINMVPFGATIFV